MGKRPLMAPISFCLCSIGLTFSWPGAASQSGSFFKVSAEVDLPTVNTGKLNSLSPRSISLRFPAAESGGSDINSHIKDETMEPAVAETATARTDHEFTAENWSENLGKMRGSSQGPASVDIKNKTVIEMTTKELRRRYQNQLSYLKSDENQELLERLMKRIGENVLAFFRNLSNTASKEQITMTRSLRLSGDYGVFRNYSNAAFDSRVEEYQYLILSNSGKPRSSWMEVRSDKENRSVDLLKGIQGFMISSGYAGYCLYFDPSHQSNSDFRYLGRETSKQRNHVIAFAQKPESRDYLNYYYDNSSSTIIRFLVQGFVWVNPDTYHISRIYTKMLSMETPASLKGTTADVEYQKTTLGDNPREFWLPRDVQVEWEFPDRTFRTRHKYSDYHLFAVETDYKITVPTPTE
jgi:hypothetical protein